ncbi:MAG TPA: 23S rRNA (uracil(1939)-C(5))-methyltransferase RlmD [Solirubrobacterales bacterium]|nr:23S rRNA (uracil(1939)-C(5))-methyltransferase RlmD [Solirubrobacterales bacterium]
MSTTTPKQARPHKGEELELTVESIAQGGRGIARRDDGFVVFVTGGLPGDRVRARVSRSKRGYAEASSIELLEPSPERVADTCVHEGEPCPGAPWQGLPYERQLELKASQVDEALRRLGGLDGFETEPIVSASSEWRYRNKLEYSWGDREGETVLGFHPRGDWRRVVDVDDCHLASPANNTARNEIRDWARENGLPPYESTDERGVLRHLVVREGTHTGQVQTRLVTAPAEFPRPPVDLHTVIDGASGGTDGPTGVLGEEYLEEEVCGLRFRISHPAFFQTNTMMAETLYGIAGDYAGLTGTEKLWDLFCGIGTIGLSLAGRAGSVWGLESVPEAVADAERNALRNGIQNATFVEADARLGITPLLERAGKPDVVIVDPPRAGLSKKIVRRLIEAESPRIVYVSCNPTTLAPNAAQLVEAGYELKRIRPVDMFPQTPHVECVALLERPAR